MWVTLSPSISPRSSCQVTAAMWAGDYFTIHFLPIGSWRGKCIMLGLTKHLSSQVPSLWYPSRYTATTEQFRECRSIYHLPIQQLCLSGCLLGLPEQPLEAHDERQGGRLAFCGGHYQWGPSLLMLWCPQGGIVTFSKFSRRKANSCGSEEGICSILRIGGGPLAASRPVESGKPEGRSGSRMDGAHVCLWMFPLVTQYRPSKGEVG